MANFIHRKGRGTGESGSAFLLVLFLLVIMTVIGLSVALITQSEVLIGGSERQSTRELYAADGALRLQIAKSLAYGDPHGSIVQWGNRNIPLSLLAPLSSGALNGSSDQVSFSPLLTSAIGPCNLCSVNQDAEYRAVLSVVNATSTRSQIVGGVTTNGAQRTLSLFVGLQPVKATDVVADAAQNTLSSEITGLKY